MSADEPFVDALARERTDRVPRMALRPHHEFPDEMDDIVVYDVQVFRAEQMSDDSWWMECSFANGESITFGVHREKRPARVSVHVTEMPVAWVDVDSGPMLTGREVRSGDERTSRRDRDDEC